MRIILTLLIAINLYAMDPKDIYNIAKQYTNYPSTIVAMAKVESTWGKNILGDDSKSLGIMQLQVPTVRWIASKDKSIAWLAKLPKKSIETILLRNDKVSIQIACIHFNYYRKFSYFAAISKYNGGWNNHSYFNRVQKAKKEWRHGEY